MSILTQAMGLAAALLLTACAALPGKMLPGKMYTLSDGTESQFEIQRSNGSGGMTAHNPVTGESFTGRYTALFIGGTVSTVSESNWKRGNTTASVNTSPTTAEARGILRGNKGTVITVHLDIEPGLVPRGQGEGIDNNGTRYQFQF